MGARVSTTTKDQESKQDFATPWPLFRACEKRYGPIGFDLAAHADNAKHARFINETMDSLKCSWSEIGTHRDPSARPLLWLNPPFSKIEPWAAKCALEAQRGAMILLLVPAAVGSNWFRDHVWPYAHVTALNGRVPFMADKPTWGYPKDCMICYFDRSIHAYFDRAKKTFDVWNWRA